MLILEVTMRSRIIFIFLTFLFSVNLLAKGREFKGPIRVDFDDLAQHDEALVYLPSDYDEDNNYPLIISLHGLGANAYIQNTIFNFKEFITKRQFILVVPEGIVGMGGLRYWNATDFCCGKKQRTKTDDVKYITSIIEKMSDEFSIDPKKVHLFGHSNGGFMANRMACEAPHLFKSFVSVAGTTFLNPTKCKKDAPLSMLHIHGTVDNIVRYNGAKGMYPGAKETLYRWVERNNCKGEAKEQENKVFYYKPYKKHFLTKEENWQKCDKKTKVSLWTVENMSHMMRVNGPYLEKILDFFFD